MIRELRDGYGFCPVCRELKPLVRHHVCYDPEYTISICRSCHSRSHHQVRQTIPRALTGTPGWRSQIVCFRGYELRLADPGKDRDIVAHCLDRCGLGSSFDEECQNIIGFVELKRHVDSREFTHLLTDLHQNFGVTVRYAVEHREETQE